MPGYRFYFLDKESHITGRIEVVYASDAEAMAIARADHSAHDLEIWTATTLIGRIRAAPQPLERVS